MPYKDYEKQKANSLKRYYEKRKEILDYQTKRLMKKSIEDKEYRKNKKLRYKTIYKYKMDICEFCKSKYDLQRHHPTYNSDRCIILCRSCHNRLHNELKDIVFVNV